MEGNGERAGDFYETPCAFDVDVPVGCENAENNSMCAFSFGKLDIPLHAFEFRVRVTEISWPRTNDDMNADGKPGAHDAKQT